MPDSRQIADFLYDYVCYRRDDYAIQLRNGGYSRQGQELTYDDVLAHVDGSYTLGVYQSTYPDELCKWVVYDIDGPRKPTDNPASARIKQQLLENVLTDNGVPYYLEPSGSPQSVHFWVFLSRPTHLHLAYNWARAMTVRDKRFVFSDEVFPKQAALNAEKPFGNLIKVPFGIHQKHDKRSYFTQSIEDIETVDITRWTPVDLPFNVSRSKGVKNNLRNSGDSDTKDFSTEDIEPYRYSNAVRPCIKRLLQPGVQLEHDDGHKLRIAIASELHASGLTTEEVVDVFRTQEDFSYGITKRQVESVKGFNRPTCRRIVWHCRNLLEEIGFKIDDVCQRCIYHQSEPCKKMTLKR